MSICSNDYYLNILDQSSEGFFLTSDGFYEAMDLDCIAGVSHCFFGPSISTVKKCIETSLDNLPFESRLKLNHKMNCSLFFKQLSEEEVSQDRVYIALQEILKKKVIFKTVSTYFDGQIEKKVSTISPEITKHNNKLSLEASFLGRSKVVKSTANFECFRSYYINKLPCCLLFFKTLDEIFLNNPDLVKEELLIDGREEEYLQDYASDIISFMDGEYENLQELSEHTVNFLFYNGLNSNDPLFDESFFKIVFEKMKTPLVCNDQGVLTTKIPFKIILLIESRVEFIKKDSVNFL